MTILLHKLEFLEFFPNLQKEWPTPAPNMPQTIKADFEPMCTLAIA